jgi:hypothetical protein
MRKHCRVEKLVLFAGMLENKNPGRVVVGNSFSADALVKWPETFWARGRFFDLFRRADCAAAIHFVKIQQAGLVWSVKQCREEMYFQDWLMKSVCS